MISDNTELTRSAATHILEVLYEVWAKPNPNKYLDMNEFGQRMSDEFGDNEDVVLQGLESLLEQGFVRLIDSEQAIQITPFGIKHLSPTTVSVVASGLKEKDKMDRPIKILFLAANPRGTSSLRLDEEMRAIDQAVRQAEFRDKFDIQQQWAVRISDLQGHLLRYRPDVVHFSGHGSETSEIVLENEYGSSQVVPNPALSKLFAVLKDNIRCVVLNACYSAPQAQAIAQHIDCVVGMSKAIGDAAAIRFAAAFYQALGYGRDINTAFDLGCLQINLENLGEEDTPKLLAISSDPKKIVLVPAE